MADKSADDIDQRSGEYWWWQTTDTEQFGKMGTAKKHAFLCNLMQGFYLFIL